MEKNRYWFRTSDPEVIRKIENCHEYGYESSSDFIAAAILAFHTYIVPENTLESAILKIMKNNLTVIVDQKQENQVANSRESSVETVEDNSENKPDVFR